MTETTEGKREENRGIAPVENTVGTLAESAEHRDVNVCSSEKTLAQSDSKRAKLYNFIEYINNGVLVGKLWSNNYERQPIKKLVFRFIYIIIPFALVFVFLCVASAKGVLNSESIQIYMEKNEISKFYSFVDDRTTTFTVCFLLFFLYFFNGFFIYSFNKIDGDARVEKATCKLSPKVGKVYCWLRFSSVCLSLILCFVVNYFIKEARNAGGEKYWYALLGNGFAFHYYSLIIHLTCFLVFRVCFMVIIDSIYVFHVTSGALLDDTSNQEKKKDSVGRKYKTAILSLEKLYDYLSVSVGVGVCLLITAGVFLYSDYNATKIIEEKFIFDNNRAKFLLFVIALSIVFFGILALCFVSVRDCIMKKKEINGIDKSVGRKKASVGAFALTVLLPGIAALVEILLPLSDLL